MPTIITKNFNLKYTLDSGQLFRFQKNKSTYLLQTKDKIFEIKQRKNKLYFQNEKRKFIKNFFRLDEDHEKIINKINKDPIINKAIVKYKGIKIMRQDPWECMIGFLCSSASNIPKIKKNMHLLSKYFGKPTEYNKKTYYAFPEINKINNLTKIKAAATGYRANYIYQVNRIVTKHFFTKLKKQKKAKQELTKLPGIGEKIADCILLFSLNHLDAFPIDTWIRKGLEQYYGLKPKQMRDFAQSYFPQYGGYAQQYLYHYWRNK